MKVPWIIIENPLKPAYIYIYAGFHGVMGVRTKSSKSMVTIETHGDLEILRPPGGTLKSASFGGTLNKICKYINNYLYNIDPRYEIYCMTLLNKFDATLRLLRAIIVEG